MTGAIARRRAGLVAGAAAVAVTLAACGSADLNASPTPSLTFPSPSVTPTATTDADGRALPGFVTDSAELPDAEAAPAELLPQTTAGWSLQTYRPQVEPVTGDDSITPGVDATVQVVYAVSPQGERYQLLELDPAKPVVIDSWTAGETVAYVTQCDPLDCDPSAPTKMLDLLTGKMSAVTVLSGATVVGADMRIGATLAGSHRWWQDGSTTSVLEGNGALTVVPENWLASSSSPDGSYLAVVRGGTLSAYVTAGIAIVNVATGALTDISTLWVSPLKCEPFRWRADDALDVNCYSPETEKWGVYTVGPGAEEMKQNASATATPPEDGAWVNPTFFVSDGVWAGPYTADADARLAPDSTAIGLARNAGFEQLTVPDATVGAARIVASVGGVLYIEATQADNLSLTTAWAYNVGSDAWTELGPLPPAGPTMGLLAAQGSPASGLTSWVVAP